MIRNTAICIMILVHPITSHGQISQTKEKYKLIEHNIYPSIVHPDIYISIDTFKIKLDSVSLKLINPKWIRKVEVIKSKKEIFGNKNPAAIIYPKRKFKEEILMILNKK